MVDAKCGNDGEGYEFAVQVLKTTSGPTGASGWVVTYLGRQDQDVRVHARRQAVQREGVLVEAVPGPERLRNPGARPYADERSSPASARGMRSFGEFSRATNLFGVPLRLGQ